MKMQMWFIFMNRIKDLIHLPDIPCELLGDCVDNSRIIQLIGRKGYNIVAQLYALLLSKLFRYDFHALCGTDRVHTTLPQKPWSALSDRRMYCATSSLASSLKYFPLPFPVFQIAIIHFSPF